MDESEKKNKSTGEEEQQQQQQQQQQQHSSDYAPYPKLDPNDTAASSPSPSPPVAAADNQDTSVTGSESNKSASDSVPVTRKSVSWSSELTRDAPPPPPPPPVANNVATTMPPESNPYISASPVPSSSSSVRETMESVRDTLGRWGKRVKEETKKAEDLAGNVWQHLKTAPSVTDAAMGRLMQSTKIIAEGGYEKVFQQSFETANDEQLLQSYACYLSTSAGPVMGTLYLSSAKIAFCSDNPLSYEVEGKKEWSYYKVVVPIHQLKAVNPSTSRANSAEKYITIISVDSHEFWFMGFVNYDSAVKCLQEALQSRNSHSV